MEFTRYHYNAKVLDIHDGDTIKVDIDLGFGVTLKNQTIRFYGLNTPEITGTTKIAGKKSTNFVKKAIQNKEIIMISHKDEKEKFGRWLGEIYYNNGTDWISLNKELLEKNLAVKFMDDGEDI